MNEKERIEKILYFRQKKEIRKANKIQYFHWIADKYHLPWIHRMVKVFKDQGRYPLIPCRELAMRYTDNRDREIAAFMGFAIRYNGDYAVINEAMEELGERPWEWFVNRGFVRLSVGDMQDGKTCGQTNWKIAQMFHNLHKAYLHSECATLGEAVLLVCKQTLTPLDQYLEKLFEDCKFNYKDDELHTLILILSPADGIGLSIWAVSPHDIRCPLTRDVRAFLGYWWPKWRPTFTSSEAIEQFGLSESDFFIASIAYARLKEKFLGGCARYEHLYSQWFKRGVIPNQVTIVKNQPKIVF